MKKHLNIKEHKARYLDYPKGKLNLDYEYFKGYNHGSKKHPSHSKIKIEKASDVSARIKNKSYFGNLKLPSGKELSFISKTSTVPIKLLEYSSGTKCNDHKKYFFYDTDYSPTLHTGAVFLYFLAEVYLTELEKILNRGFVKEYVPKEENLNYLKGKLLVKKQIKNNYVDPKFYCKYFDLTIDNFCNQMVLYAGYLLANFLLIDEEISHSVKENLSSLRNKIFNYVEDLKDRITLRSVISPSEANNIIINRKNEYYKTIIDISRIVISRSFYQQSGPESELGYNYLIDMNVIFERVIYKLFSKVFNEISEQIKLADQKRFKDVGKFVDLPYPNNLNIIPDITVFKEDLPIAVIDSKYKSKVSSTDYYQMLVYSLYFKTYYDEPFKTAIVVHFDEKDFDGERFDIKEGKIKLETFADEEGIERIKDIKLFRIGVFIKENEESTFEINNLEKELKDKLQNGEDEWKQLNKSLFRNIGVLNNE